MFRFLRTILHISIFGVLSTVLAYLIIDAKVLKNILTLILDNFDNRIYQLMLMVSIAIYILIIILACSETWFKKKKSVSINSKSGKIEVNFSTLENITKTYVSEEKIVKSVSVKVISTYSTPIISIDVECYRTNNLNEKLGQIKENLENHIEKMVGIKPKKTILKVIKIDEQIVDDEEILETGEVA